MYSYKNELQETTIVSDPHPTVAQRLVDDLEKQGERKSAVIRVDFLWDVSLMKFIFELTVSSWAAMWLNWPIEVCSEWRMGCPEPCGCASMRCSLL